MTLLSIPDHKDISCSVKTTESGTEKGLEAIAVKKAELL